MPIGPGEYTVRLRRRGVAGDSWTDDVSRSIRLDPRGLVVRRDYPIAPTIVMALGAIAAGTGAGLLLFGFFASEAHARDATLVLGIGGGLFGGGALATLIGTVYRIDNSISAEVPARTPHRAALRVTSGLAGFVVSF